MKSLYKKARTEYKSLTEIDPELPWLLTLDLVVAVVAVGGCMAVMA